MFADDIALVKMAAEQYGPLPQPIVEVGGLENPCIADYDRTIKAMAELQRRGWAPDEQVAEAQRCRYLNIHRPLSFLGEYRIENPETGGMSIGDLANHCENTGHYMGTVIALSVLEHTDEPFSAVDDMHLMLSPGGMCIVSVPFQFPHHPSPEDNWRFTPTGLSRLFNPGQWAVLYCDWRLRIPADAGVLDLHTGKPQAVESCGIIARAR